MNEEFKSKALKAALAETRAMLEEHWTEIMDDYEQAAIVHAEEHAPDDNAKFKFGVSLGTLMQPEGRDIKVSAKIRWSVTHTDESEGRRVSDQPELGLED